MIDEFHVRAEVARIESLETTALRKARMLLGVARRVRPALLRLAILGEHHYRIGDPLRAARFEEARRRLRDVHDDVRSRAAANLGRERTPLGYGYAPRANAALRWRQGRTFEEVLR